METQEQDFGNVHSTRFFWWSARGLTYRFSKLIYRGTEENCNRTLGIRVPGGVLFILTEWRIRQLPCDECIEENRKG